MTLLGSRDIHSLGGCLGQLFQQRNGVGKVVFVTHKYNERFWKICQFVRY